jgi:transcriptional antiterminator RfaH
MTFARGKLFETGGYCQMNPIIAEKPKWYALQTHALQEERAAENLNAWGVETFAPKYKERRSNPYTGRPVYFTRSLFPQYMFARFDAGRMLRKVWFTRGVTKVIGFGDGPSPVEDEIIELIKSRVGKEGFVEFNEDLKRGDKVVIRDGPLANLEGIFERDIEDGDRVLMLLTAISYQGHVTLERELLKKIS